MCEGMVINARNENGAISIESRKGMQRTFIFENNRIDVKMRPRKERWYGSLGGYSPEGSHGIHLVAEEGQQHFCSEKEALEWLIWKKNMQYVYTNDGIVVGWYTVADPNSSRIAVNVELWQFYIDGQKPMSLNGFKNNNIELFLRMKHLVAAKSWYVFAKQA